MFSFKNITDHPEKIVLNRKVAELSAGIAKT